MRRAIFTVTFWLDAFERAIKAMAAALLGALGADKVVAQDLKWGLIWWAVGIAGAVSVLSSIASAPSGGTISPASLVRRGDPGHDLDRHPANDRGAIDVVVVLLIGLLVLAILTYIEVRTWS